MRGACEVNAGPAVVNGDLTISPGSVLLAAFALNDKTGTGTSSLTVKGNILVRAGAVAVMGCNPANFACLDDPNQNQPTLSSMPPSAWTCGPTSHWASSCTTSPSAVT